MGLGPKSIAQQQKYATIHQRQIFDTSLQTEFEGNWKMDDVASVRLENANLKRIQSKLLQWEIKEHPLAPLTNQQEDALDQLNQLLGEQCAKGPPTEKDPDKSYSNQLSNEFPSKLKFELSSLKSGIDTSSDFLAWFDQVEDKIHDRSNCSYRKYLCELESRSLECNTILQEIHFCLQKLEDLKKECAFVSNNTSSLNSSSEKLILEQNQLSKIDAEISKRLHYFTQAEHLTQRLQNPTLSVSSDNFRECLNKVDDCLDYLRKNVNFKDASAYIVRYKHCLSKAITLMRCYVTQILVQASYQVNFPNKSNEDEKSNSEMTFALFYGKFHTTAIKVKKISSLIEERIERSPEYEMLLVELHQCYLTERAKVMSPAVEKAIKELKVNNKGDHCALVRGSCAFLVHICQDEYRLFYQFFTKFSDQLNSYLEGLCVILYDNLRPFIIHINHLETLAEICGILRTELLDEQVQQNPETLEAFGKVAFQLLQDVQERLVFRAHLYLQSDILNYNPSAGDLAYPDKLEMMESIALSLQEPTLRRSDSRVSVSSSISSVATDSELVDSIRGRFLSNSPADLHGMWYPTVRRTLVCLSRLYRCVDRPIFQGLSQEALKYCIQSVSNAASKISTSKTVIDGELFEIKHLLILREQIAPFRVDFTVKETSLDFSKIKTAAFGLLQKRRQLFSLGSNNALLEFLLEGTPQVKEHLLDSRKDVDRQLKTVCEQFIKDAVQMLIGPLLIFLEKANSLVSEINVPDKPASKINYALRQSPWASPQQISVYIQESQRLLKSKLSGLQRSMQLYLSNRDTEFIIFRPIRNNIISAFVKLEQILTTNAYTQDDMTIANCPSAEQVSLLLSSVSILADSTLAPGPITTKGSSSQQTQVTRKLSEEKKVSFDDSV